MKQVSKFTCWTDYPFTELGDVAYQPAPVRRVTVVGYDGDKYAKVKVVEGDKEIVTEVKSGYLYTLPVRYKQAIFVNRRKLERMTTAINLNRFIPK